MSRRCLCLPGFRLVLRRPPRSGWQGFDELLDALAGDFIAVDVGEDDEEFVASKTADDVSWPGAVAEQGGCVGEELITDCVPERVIDFLESVEVDEHDCGTELGCTSGDERPVECVDHC